MRDDLSPYPLAKRVLDKIVATLLLVVLSPFFAVAAIAIALGKVFCRRDRGPWLYRERRVSAGREFDLLKFRTLRREVLEHGVSGHARVHESSAEKLTWAGRRVLKPWYLDELPQLFNVLRGDMSLVGPRPWPPAMVRDQEAAGLDYRNCIVAGWTGPAQVRKGLTPTASYADLDLDYVETCRRSRALGLVRTDLALLAETVKVVARGEGLEF